MTKYQFNKWSQSHEDALLVSRKVNKVEESFLRFIQAIRVGCVKGGKTQIRFSTVLAIHPTQGKQRERERERREEMVDLKPIGAN